MTKLEEFKSFAKKNPSLITYVKNDTMSWQKFYELYDLYGEDNSVWNEYLTIKEDKKEIEEVKKTNTFNNIMDMAKNIDVDKVQDSITSLQKALGLFGDLFTKNTPSTSNYTPRALYRTFED